MKLFVFASSRKLKQFLDSAGSGLLPKTMLINEFFNQAVYSSKFSEVSSIDRLILMQKAVLKTKATSLGIPSNFYEFLKNSEYIFSFFKELAITGKSIDDLKNRDIYADYDEHLNILDELFKNYKFELEKLNLYDDITITYDYLINSEFFQNFSEITIFIDGVLSKFELDILYKAKKLSVIKLNLHANSLSYEIIKHFIKFDDILEMGAVYELNLSNLTIAKIKEKNTVKKCIDIRGFDMRAMQCFYIFEKISEFIKSGIEPKNIVVILPEESFSETLMSLDRTNMLNFAMGKNVKNSLFYRLLEILCEIASQDIKVNLKDNYLESQNYTTKELFLNELNLNLDFLNEFKIYFDEEISFNKFSYFINQILDYSQEKELKKELSKPLYEIEIYLSKQSLKLKEVCEILKLNLKNIDYVGGGEVSVIGLLESRGLKFEGVIIPDFNDDVVPKRSINEMFLNTTIRKQAGLISYKDRENLQKFYYKNLIDNAKKVAICFDSSEGKLKSRLLNELENDEIIFKKDTEFSDLEYLNIFRNSYEPFEYKKDLTLTHNFFKNPLSFSRLDLFLKSPASYAYKYIFNINPPKPVNENLDAREKGELIHKTLEKCYENSNIFDYNKFRDIFLKLSQNYHIDELEKLIILKTFKKAKEKFKQHEADGWQVFECEKELNCVEYDDILIKGKIDRIDKNINEIFIVDYKTGSCDKKSLQLPFYKALLGQKDETKAAFFSLSQMEFVTCELNLDDLKEEIDKLKEISNKPYDFSDNKNYKFSEYEILVSGLDVKNE